MILDQTGTLGGVSRHDYLLFGEELAVTTGVRNTVPGYVGTDVRQKFTQKERDDETGLDYFGARYYFPTQGRFTSPDEFTGGPDEYYEFHNLAAQNPTFYADLTDPQSLNKYQYAYNNPLLYIDPDGHQGVREAAREVASTTLDVAGGVLRGIGSSFSFGAVGAPRPDDSMASRVGRAAGTVIEGVLGGDIVGGSVGITVGTGGAAALTGAPELGVAVGGAMVAGAIKNGVAVIMTPMQASNSSEGKPQPVEGSSDGLGTGKRASESTKNKIRDRDNNTGVYCGTETTRAPGRNRSNIDHSNPRSRNGDTTDRNLQNTCEHCNKQKGARTNSENLRWLGRN